MAYARQDGKTPAPARASRRPLSSLAALFRGVIFALGRPAVRRGRAGRLLPGRAPCAWRGVR